jgi:hypothetical protein
MSANTAGYVILKVGGHFRIVLKGLTRSPQPTEARLGEIKSVKPSLLKKASFDLPEYTNNNRDNIDCATYMRKGFFSGGGAAESAGRTVSRRRLKLPGTRRNIPSARNMAAPASKYGSCSWESEVVGTIRDQFNFHEDLSRVRPVPGKFRGPLKF